MDETFRVVEQYGQGAKRMPANAGDPLRALAAAGRCIENARDTLSGEYRATLAAVVRDQRCELRPTADSTALIAYDLYSSYLVRYEPIGDVHGAKAYSLSMEPRREGERMGGFASFLADSAGRVHVTLRGRAATTADPIVPACPRDWRGARAGLPYCLEYVPRQRWGVTSELPTIGWSRSGSGTVASGDTLHVIPHFRGILPQDSIVEARIRWRAGERDSVIRRGPDGIGEPFGGSVVFRLKHVYRDTGYKEIHFTVKTRANEIYEMRDSVRVLVGWRRP
jgi:hypothetical protein